MADPTFVTVGPWGAGNGGMVLTAAQGDTNLWNLLVRIVAMEDNPPEPVEISNIEVIGNQMKVFLANGDSYGPFTLPTAMFHFRGAWANNTLYQVFDVITVDVPDIGGVFFVNKEHTSPVSPAPFDPNANDGTDPYYFQAFPAASTSGGGGSDVLMPAVKHALFGGI